MPEVLAEFFQVISKSDLFLSETAFHLPAGLVLDHLESFVLSLLPVCCTRVRVHSIHLKMWKEGMIVALFKLLHFITSIFENRSTTYLI